MLRVGLACIKQHGIMFSAAHIPAAAKEASAAAAAEAALAGWVSETTQSGNLAARQQRLWSPHYPLFAVLVPPEMCCVRQTWMYEQGTVTDMAYKPTRQITYVTCYV
jgi:hypothetical protein